MHDARLAASVSLLLLLTSCSGEDRDGLQSRRAPGATPTPLSLDQLAADDGQWVMPAKDYASTRYSGLAHQPGNIFQSIIQGRPQGMPAYGGKAPDEVIWKIVAYVQSLAEPYQQNAEDTLGEGTDREHGNGGQ